MDRPTCSTCIHWHRHQWPKDQTFMGDCDRYPPQVMFLNDIPLEHRPKTYRHDSCGEHQDFGKYIKHVERGRVSESYESRRESLQKRAMPGPVYARDVTTTFDTVKQHVPETPVELDSR